MNPFQSLREYELFVYTLSERFPPDIKHHRVPAPDLGITAPKLPFLIREIDAICRSST
jgi:glutamate dehydrogenase/leucine dehydrogenase